MRCYLVVIWFSGFTRAKFRTYADNTAHFRFAHLVTESHSENHQSNVATIPSVSVKPGLPENPAIGVLKMKQQKLLRHILEAIEAGTLKTKKVDLHQMDPATSHGVDHLRKADLIIGIFHDTICPIQTEVCLDSH